MSGLIEAPRASARAGCGRWLALAAGAVMLAGCQGPYLTEQAFYEDASPEPLSAEAIKGLLVGNTVVSDEPDGPYRVYFPDEEHVVAMRSRHYRDQGRWRTTDEGMCAHFDNWWGNVERCWKVTRRGDDVSWLDPYGDASAGDATIVPGNVADL